MVVDLQYAIFRRVSFFPGWRMVWFRLDSDSVFGDGGHDVRLPSSTATTTCRFGVEDAKISEPSPHVTQEWSTMS